MRITGYKTRKLAFWNEVNMILPEYCENKDSLDEYCKANGYYALKFSDGREFDIVKGLQEEVEQGVVKEYILNG
jgi:hypothetical protein